MATPADEIAIRPATGADWAVIRGWLRLPEIQRWWGTAASTEAEVRLVMETESAMARMVIAAGRPVGYAHAIDAQHWGSGLPETMPAGTWDIDCFIADPEWRGRGGGSLRLAEEGYREKNGGDGFNLIVDKRNGDMLTGEALLAVGWRFGDDVYFAPEIKAGYRAKLAGGPAKTTAHFEGGQDFTLDPEDAFDGGAVATRLTPTSIG